MTKTGPFQKVRLLYVSLDLFMRVDVVKIETQVLHCLNSMIKVPTIKKLVCCLFLFPGYSIFGNAN